MQTDGWVCKIPQQTDTIIIVIDTYNGLDSPVLHPRTYSSN